MGKKFIILNSHATCLTIFFWWGGWGGLGLGWGAVGDELNIYDLDHLT